MRIRLWVKNVETGETLEELGTCLTDSPSRAVQMYDQDEKWAELGYAADICWEDITNQAAAALGSIKTEKKAAAARENGTRGGRPARLTDSTEIALQNPWSDAIGTMTWGEIKAWAREHIHPGDLDNWLRRAQNLAKAGDSEKLGIMIIGS